MLERSGYFCYSAADLHLQTRRRLGLVKLSFPSPLFFFFFNFSPFSPPNLSIFPLSLHKVIDSVFSLSFFSAGFLSFFPALPSMDRIEPVRGPEDRPDGTGDPTTTHSSSHLTPAAAEAPVHPNRQRQRTLSRARRPSIRIQRLSSVSSLSNNGDDSNQQQQHPSPPPPPPPDQRRTAADDSVTSTGARDNRRYTAQPDDEDEAWRGNRRRSSSEPRPGRWSSPPPIALSRVATPMVPLTEVRTDQSPATQDPSNRASPDKLTAAEPHPVPARPGRLRRTSQAAMSRFSRNRASTVAGPVPRVTDFNDFNDFNDQDNENSRPDEYDPHIVNVLDVIGTCILILCLLATQIPNHECDSSRSRSVGPVDSHQRPEFSICSRLVWIREPRAYVYPPSYSTLRGRRDHDRYQRTTPGTTKISRAPFGCQSITARF